MDPTTNPKAYWSILKKKNLNIKKYLVSRHFIIITNILLLLKRGLRSSTTFLAKQCTLVENTSKLPIDSSKRRNNFLSTLSFTKDDITNTIKNLNPNKAHGFDMISIRMLKICGDSILKALKLIFKSYIESGKSPIEWEKTNVFAVH